MMASLARAYSTQDASCWWVAVAAILHSGAPADDDFGVADVVSVDDDSIEGVLSSHRIVVVSGCHSEGDCEALRAELGRAAKILKRVSMSGGSVALGSVALHEASTAACQERYRLPPPGDGGSADNDNSDNNNDDNDNRSGISENNDDNNSNDANARRLIITT